MSDQIEEFKKIHAAIGTLIDDDEEEEYFKRLAQQTTNVDAYLRWSVTQDLEEPPTTDPAQVLRLLQLVDVTDKNAVHKLADSLGLLTGGFIPLAKDSNRILAVVSDEMALTLGPFGSPEELDLDDPNVKIPGPAPPCHSMVLALDTAGGTVTGAVSAGSSSASGAKLASTPPVPKYVLPIGTLVVKDLRKLETIPEAEREGIDEDVDSRALLDTNYAVVIDVTVKQRPVWLIYNRHPYDDEEGGTVDADPSKDKQRVFSTGVNFDSALIMPSLTSWDIAKTTPTMAAIEASIASTKGNVALEAKAALLSDLARYFPGAAPA